VNVEGGDSEGGNAISPTNEAKLFVGGGFDVNSIDRQPKGGGNLHAHGGKVGEKFWGFGEKSGIDIKNGGLFFFGEAGGFGQEKSAGDIFPFWVGVGKVGSDISCAEGTENCIGQSVEKDICVGVAFEPTFVGNGDGTEDEGTPRDQRMNIITKANA
jgi:hypothetical protein